MIELKDYQKLRMAPMANSQATITKKGMRLTVLTDGLLRIEKSKDCQQVFRNDKKSVPQKKDVDAISEIYLANK